MTQSKKPSEAEILDLIGSVLNDTADADARDRLSELLARDESARQVYLRYANLEVALRTNYAMTEDEFSQFQAVPAPHNRPGEGIDHSARPLFRRWTVWFAGIAGAGIAAALMVAWNWRDHGSANRPVNSVAALPADAVAVVTKLAGARWGANQAALTVSSALRPGLIDLIDGLVELKLVNGVNVVLEGPARLELVDQQRAALQLGRLVARVPANARGFFIQTPVARIVDLGTEFGVGVSNKGEAEVQVFEGEVVTECKNLSGEKLDQHLTAGNAVSIMSQAEPQDIPFQPERFVRMFPTDQDGGQPAGPLYNRSRFDTVHVVPAPKSIKIDGDLSDWDRSGAFYSACFPPYHETHYLEGQMMYDANCLYLAAHVGDPAPMLSSMDPLSDPNQYAWRGGSVIVRLGVDRQSSWPLDAVGSAESIYAGKKIPLRPQDVDDKIVHLTMWYHRPTKQARLQLSFGMDFHGEQKSPIGYQAQFRMDPNGLGYTLEYAIPWSLLRVGEDPPRASDTVAANWTVHWSDHDGRLSRGHLVEVTNLDVQPYRFLRAKTWGKAVFHATGNLPPDTVSAKPVAPPLAP